MLLCSCLKKKKDDEKHDSTTQKVKNGILFFNIVCFMGAFFPSLENRFCCSCDSVSCDYSMCSCLSLFFSCVYRIG